MSAAVAKVSVPEWATWGQRSGLMLRTWTPWGENGRKTGRWCHGETEAPRRCWCSEECVDKYSRVWSWGAIKSYVQERDNNICQRCGTTEPKSPPRYRYDPWDVDHIIPVRDGGTDDPANLRLLCMPCHIKVGYEQRRAGRLERQGDLFGSNTIKWEPEETVNERD